MAFRNTIQRKLVFEAIRKLERHATANEIFSEISRAHPSISRATVYRNLNILADENRILKVHVPNSADYYDPLSSPHQHALCARCGKLFDLRINNLDPAIQEAAKSINFDVENFDIMLHGICSDCAQAEICPTQSHESHIPK